MKTKNDFELILLRANIRKKKDKRTFVLTGINVYQHIGFNEGLYIMHRCGLPLYAMDGLNQASFVGVGKDIGCYEKDCNEIIIAVLQQKHKLHEVKDSVCIFPKEPEFIHLSGLSGSMLNKTFEKLIKLVDNGRRLKEDFVEEALRQTRLSLIPKGWEVVTKGNVQPGDRYLLEDRARYLTITPAIFSWTSCDVSFSAHRPGTPVKKYSWDDSIIIRKNIIKDSIETLEK